MTCSTFLVFDSSFHHHGRGGIVMILLDFTLSSIHLKSWIALFGKPQLLVRNAVLKYECSVHMHALVLLFFLP